MTVCIRYS